MTNTISREAAWRRFEQALARRERGRLIRIGHIKMKSQPIVMVKDDNDVWKLPSLSPEGSQASSQLTPL
jgi:hypothetical protein